MITRKEKELKFLKKLMGSEVTYSEGIQRIDPRVLELIIDFAEEQVSENNNQMVYAGHMLMKAVSLITKEIEEITTENKMLADKIMALDALEKELLKELDENRIKVYVDKEGNFKSDSSCITIIDEDTGDYFNIN